MKLGCYSIFLLLFLTTTSYLGQTYLCLCSIESPESFNKRPENQASLFILFHSTATVSLRIIPLSSLSVSANSARPHGHICKWGVQGKWTIAITYWNSEDTYGIRYHLPGRGVETRVNAVSRGPSGRPLNYPYYSISSSKRERFHVTPLATPFYATLIPRISASRIQTT